MSVPAYREPLRGSTTSERSGTAGRPSLVPTSYHDWAASFDSQSWLPNGLGELLDSLRDGRDAPVPYRRRIAGDLHRRPCDAVVLGDRDLAAVADVDRVLV